MKFLIGILCCTFTSVSFAGGLPLGDAQVEVNPAGKYALTYIGGDAARALYESMTDVTPLDTGGIDSQFTIKKGSALECTEDIHMEKTNYLCSISINSDGSLRTQATVAAEDVE